MIERVPNVDKLAVNVRDLSFEYKKGVPILNNLSLQIPGGKIFALLGPNGCGKTTLLRLVLGRLKFKNGFINVFGEKPGSSTSDIPGPGVGYMPQEIALFSEFTIKESLTYYGIIYHMDHDEITERFDELAELLNLPDTECNISKLSGGQQRLTSIAVTMIHRPKLLILDEPTVGVDSILRSRIWKYLDKICKNYGTTVIITTHYIEEARTANNVGFMNYGFILCQGNPNRLMNQYNCRSLEDIFLIICKKKMRKTKTSKLATIEEDSIVNVLEYSDHCKWIDYNDFIDVKNHFIDFYRIKALLLKYYIILKRRLIFYLIFCAIPLSTIFLCANYIGSMPHNLGMAIYNADTGSEQLSHQFLDELDDKHYLKFNFNNTESAVQSVIKGDSVFAIVFHPNFSQSFKERIFPKKFVTDNQLEETTIKLFTDMSNRLLVNFYYTNLIQSLQKFLMDISVSKGYNPGMFSVPINYEEPIYGVTNYNFADFFTTGIMLYAFTLLPMVASSFLFLIESKTGSIERVLVAGVKPIEILFSYMIFIILSIGIQLLIVLLTTYFLIDITLKGQLIDVYLLLLSQGIVGASIGLTIALIACDVVLAGIAISALAINLFIVSGIISPVQAIPYYFQIFIFWTPLTLPLESLKSIMLRGLNMFNNRVLIGFIVGISYNIVFFIINIILINK